MTENDGKERLVVESGDVGGIRYWICRNRLLGQVGTGYWTVYVDASCITAKDGSPARYEGDLDAALDVHGGCTFFGKAGDLIQLAESEEIPENMPVAGWDYMHGSDLADPMDPFNLSSRQTLHEVKADVRSALGSFLGRR